MITESNIANANSQRRNILLDYRTEDFGMLDENGSLPVDKKSVPKKLRKKAPKKKKGRASGNNSLPGSENMGDKNKPKSETPEESEKHRMRKKCRSKGITEVNNTQNKPVKFYSPLPLFIKLQLDSFELYKCFQPYILMFDQLKDNGFPLESPYVPGKVYFANSKYSPSKESRENPNQRFCSRCNDKFTVSDDGLYYSETICNYHSGKRMSIGGISGAGPYSCCGSYLSTGCLTGKQHVTSEIVVNNSKFVKTRVKRHKHSTEQIYALDCEMCYTLRGLEVARISVVGTDGLTVYDSYVVPDDPVIDYNTMYSGITAKDLKDVKTTLADVQAFLLKLLTSQTILIGHGLNNDLKALHIIHSTIVDTSVVFPHQYGYPYKRSLKSLTSSFLQQSIQQGDCGHDSVEDARACVELMLWKVDADVQLYNSRPQPNIFPYPVPPAQAWPVNTLSINPAFVPCNIGYWVAAVGGGCDIF